MTKLLIEDCDTGESTLEIYEVPEGICVTLGASDENNQGDCYTSCIISRQDEAKLLKFLLERAP